MYPSAQPDCMKPVAFARCSGGQVSATNSAPADHSPPNPNPISARQNSNPPRLDESAVPADANEYSKIV